MKASQYRAVREELGWSNAQLAKAIGLSRRAPYRYENGEIKVPEPTARLLRLLVMLRLSSGERKFNDIVERLQ
jgi:transcriptional regulator with XRE-family HTH domain